MAKLPSSSNEPFPSGDEIAAALIRFALASALGSGAGSPGTKPTFNIALNAGSGLTVTWIADVDCVLTAIRHVPNGTGVVYSRDGTTMPVAQGSTFKSGRGQIIYNAGNPGTGAQMEWHGREVFLKDDKLYMANGGAGLVFANLTFEQLV